MTTDMTQSDAEPNNNTGSAPELIKCGLIMPISATSGHSEKHWSDVEKLLHRSIANAGFSPLNVWVNERTDRVSERIIGNIFRYEIVVADISDLNPNVMFELGLRLASKKPTVVIVNDSGIMPFDIRDFSIIHYPGDLNILGMEVFFSKLEESIRSKYKSYINNSYTPFLNNVVVEVLLPQTTSVSADDLILSRLDEISARFQRLEQINADTTKNSQEEPLRNAMLSMDITFHDASFETMLEIEQSIDKIPQLVCVMKGSSLLRVLSRNTRFDRNHLIKSIMTATDNFQGRFSHTSFSSMRIRHGSFSNIVSSEE